MTVTTQEARAWTTPGTQDAAQRTYASVKTALQRSSHLAGLDYEVFLQGSYANSTNTRGDSDVDVVVMLRSTFFPDTSPLDITERQRHEAQRTPGSHTPSDFRSRVHRALNDYYGAQRVDSRDKCLRVAKQDGYVDADVVPAFQYRRYTSFPSYGPATYDEGIRIDPLTGGPIVNYPKMHKRNGERKNSATATQYKSTVRQIKRLRRLAVDRGLVQKGAAPGYLLECMTYNLPDYLLSDSDDARRLRSAVYWLQDQSPEQMAATFKSCDEIHTLFGTDPGDHNQYIASNVMKQLWDLI
ncbi:nucleotidyltransferase domain-containing protein [Cellulomonas iranensis]|uniref:nucleotidyltransferase domain-containing protein n=1 Tax=Cellulomonas iranensis TaxID=76862 RepID=UPI003D7CF22F